MSKHHDHHHHDHDHGHQHGHDHGHSHAHGHHHHGDPNTMGRAFAIAIVLNTVFVAIEFFYGFLANSTALMADAGHSPYFEQAATFNGLVEAFLARHR